MQSGKEKIRKICDAITNETLLPAKKQAEEMLDEARKAKDQILQEANKEKEKILKLANEEREKEKRVFESSMKLASKQMIDELKQQVEKEFFAKNMQELIEKESASKDVIAKLLQVMIDAIAKEGIDADLIAYIPKMVSAKEIVSMLMKDIMDKLKDKELELGDFAGGVKIRLVDQKITLDMTDAALKELLIRYIQKDFRDMIFS